MHREGRAEGGATLVLARGAEGIVHRHVLDHGLLPISPPHPRGDLHMQVEVFPHREHADEEAMTVAGRHGYHGDGTEDQRTVHQRAQLAGDV